VETYVDPTTEAGLESLRRLAQRPVVIDVGSDSPVVGHADFRPLPPLEVLDAAQAAQLLAVEEAAIVELADRGELPGRKIGGAWRFSRAALLEWLSLK